MNAIEKTIYHCSAKECGFSTENKASMESHISDHEIETGARCICKHASEPQRRLMVRQEVIGYGRSLAVSVYLGKDPKIAAWYASQCDCGNEKSIKIRFCPLCGREL